MMPAANALSDRSSRQREKILAGAQAAFNLFGFAKCTMEEIARHGAVSRASVYQHFNNKDGVFYALVEQHYARSLEDASEACADGALTFLEKLSRVVEARIGYFARLVLGSPHSQEVERTGLDLTRGLIARSNDEYRAMIAGLLSDADRDGIIDLDARGVSAIEAATILINGAQAQRYDFVEFVSLDVCEAQRNAFLKIYVAGLGYRGED